MSSPNLLLLDSGDALVGGGPLAEVTQGKVIIDGMNHMGYDAMALGPKELGLGQQILQQRLAEARFPILSANVVLSETQELVADPYAIIQVGEHRIGVIGLTRIPDGRQGAFWVLDPQQAAREYVPHVAAQADTVIVLTNLPYRPAIGLAEEVPGIDLVVAALPIQLPTTALRTSNATLVITAEQPLPRHAGRRVGRLMVTVESDGSLTGESWQSVSLGPQIPDDPLMRALLEKHNPE